MADVPLVTITAGVPSAGTGTVMTNSQVVAAVESAETTIVAAIEALEAAIEAATIDAGTPTAESSDVLSVQDLTTQPARSLKTVTPSDIADLPDGVCKGLIVTADGHVTVVAEDDHVTNDERDLGSWAAGSIIPVRVKRVYDTGTDATLLAMY